jgi:hypothetical protein
MNGSSVRAVLRKRAGLQASESQALRGFREESDA